MKFHIKGGVSAVGVRPEMIMGLMIAESVWDEFDIGGGLVVTSLTDGRGIHRDGSLHFVGLAADLRTNPELEGGVPADVLDDLSEALRYELSEEWDVLVEPTHIHIEYQLPRKE